MLFGSIEASGSMLLGSKNAFDSKNAIGSRFQECNWLKEIWFIF